MFPLGLLLVATLSVKAQEGRNSGNADTATISLEKGITMLLEPSTRRSCNWAVVRDTADSTHFFNLDAEHQCPGTAFGGPHMLELRFGNEIQCGPVTVTFSCDTVSVWDFDVNQSTSPRNMSTSIKQLCAHNGDGSASSTANQSFQSSLARGPWSETLGPSSSVLTPSELSLTQTPAATRHFGTSTISSSIPLRPSASSQTLSIGSTTSGSPSKSQISATSTLTSVPYASSSLQSSALTGNLTASSRIQGGVTPSASQEPPIANSFTTPWTTNSSAHGTSWLSLSSSRPASISSTQEPASRLSTCACT